MDELLSVDRFEGETAVLEDEDGECRPVPRALLSPQAREGDLVRLIDGIYCPDAAATAARREEIRALEQRLLGRG